MNMSCSKTAPALPLLQSRFLQILPRIEAHAHIYFRGVRCESRRSDLVQETVSIAWESFVRASQRGKDPRRFITAIARFAVLHVRCHRYFCGSSSPNDALSEAAQYRRGYKAHSFSGSRAWEEALKDNRKSPVDEQVCFKLDFREWLRTLDSRSRKMVEQMILGERTCDLAKSFGISAARISQLRRWLQEEWNRFCDGHAASEGQAVHC